MFRLPLSRLGETWEKQNALDKAVDAIRGQFGTGAICRGSLLKKEDSGETRR